MKINSIVYSSGNLSPEKYNIPSLKKQNFALNYDCLNIKGVNSTTVPSQMPNVTFKGDFARDCIRACRRPDGKMPSSIEMKKYTLSLEVDRDMKSENYLAALLGKVAIANVCKIDGSNIIGARDGIENEIKQLYTKLPLRQRVLARAAIVDYEKYMGNELDEIPLPDVKIKKKSKAKLKF